MRLLTWNVGGVKAPEDFDMSEFFKEDSLSDIIVVGLQEIIPPVHNWKGDRDKVRAERWQKHIQNALNEYYTLDNYTHVTQNTMVGSFLTIFVKTELKHLIREIGWSHF